MDKEKSAVEMFLEGDSDNGSGKNMFEETATNPFEQQFVQKEVEVKEEKSVPYHKDAKLQKFIEKEVEKRMKDTKTPEVTTRTTQEDEDDYYVRLIGNDSPEKLAMIREAKARDERLLQQAEERAYGRMTKAQQAEADAERQAQEELESAFESIEENYGVDISSNTPTSKKTRQDFSAFVERIAPKDKHGDVLEYPDMNSAWETFQEIQNSKKTPSRAKELAARSMARSAETITVQPKRVDWNAVDEYMDSLS